MTVGLNNEANRIKWVQNKLAKIPKRSRILDAGAGELKYKKYCSHLEYVAQDFGQYEGVGDGKGLQTCKWDQSRLDITSDITEIPEQDGSFDAIMCIEVFEHLPQPIKAIHEFSRLLKHEGTLILTAPFCSLTHFAPFHFYSGFNRYFYEKYLKEYGFEILEIGHNGNYFEYLGQEIHRIPNILKKYAGKLPNFFDRFVLRLVLKILERYSHEDQGSEELLCFGYHLLAIKIQQ